MKQCEFCGASMLDDAGFCGKCGRLPSRISKRATRISSLPGFPMEFGPDQNSENEPTISASGKHIVLRNPSGSLHPITLIPIPDEQKQEEENEEEEDLLAKRAALFGMGMPLASHEEEESRRVALFGMGLPPDNQEDEEEEKRRRAALFGLALPLVEEITNAPTQGQAPVIQGTPQMAHLPVLPNTPPLQGGPAFGPASAVAPGNSPLLPHPRTPHPLFPPPPPRPIRQPGTPPNRAGAHAPGCLPLAAIFIAAVLLILTTSFGLGLTVLAPGLSLSGNTNVTPGSSLTMHGHNFWPNSSVTLTLDNNLPLYLARQQAPTQLSRHAASFLTAADLVFYTFAPSPKSNVISAHGDGTFDATIQISTSWSPGKHTVHASESVSHRSASLVFSIAQASPTATATATPTTPAPTATATATATATPTAVPPPTLSCTTPGNLALGPISELSSQLASASVTLCTSGAGTLTWQASWNHNQAPWLQINQGSGTVQAPNQFQATFSASAKNLAAGTYTATVIFTALESNTTQAVNITLTVKTGCVTAAPQSLSFSGVENISNPAGAQNITVTNCGITSDWSAKITSGSNWLSLNSSKGTLKGGSTKTIAVSASNLNAGLKAGTYPGTIIVTIGSHTAKINVTLVVQPAPTISASPTSLDANSSPCITDGSSSCTITLTNNSRTSALTWSASASGASGVSVQASSNTIAAGGTEQVTIVVPSGNCGKTITVTFNAPGNTATVTWNCPQIT
ncbi:MAG TPA: hypothetical protein VF458_23400 [Ktedonobacteraceae bacterium]